MVEGIPDNRRCSTIRPTISTLTDQLATSCYDDSKAPLHLLPRVPPKTTEEIRATPERLSRIHTFNSLVDLLYELALHRKSDTTLNKLHSMAQLKWLDGNANANTNHDGSLPFNKDEDKDKATATVATDVEAVAVVVVTKVKAEEDGIGGEKSKRRTPKCLSFLPRWSARESGGRRAQCVGLHH